MAVNLQRLAYQGLITKTMLDKSDVDFVMAGNVIQEAKTSNISQEAAINVGFPASIGAHTVAMVRDVLCSFMFQMLLFFRNQHALLTSTLAQHTQQACISSSVAITSAAEKILSGGASTIIAGGVETFSDVRIHLTRPIIRC